jgi:hypothetical protein
MNIAKIEKVSIMIETIEKYLWKKEPFITAPSLRTQ